MGGPKVGSEGLGSEGRVGSEGARWGPKVWGLKRECRSRVWGRNWGVREAF